jgi:hypothetical protein
MQHRLEDIAGSDTGEGGAQDHGCGSSKGDAGRNIEDENFYAALHLGTSRWIG